MGDAEQWREIPSTSGAYEASSHGRVRRSASGPSALAGQILRDCDNGTGYRMVGLYLNRKSYRKYVHRLVAEAFIGPCPTGYEVNHKDFDRGNCRADNLEYLTRRDNVLYTIRAGRHIDPLTQIPRNNPSKLTPDAVRSIRTSQASISSLSRQFGVDRKRIRDVQRGSAWRHVE